MRAYRLLSPLLLLPAGADRPLPSVRRLAISAMDRSRDFSSVQHAASLPLSIRRLFPLRVVLRLENGPGGLARRRAAWTLVCLILHAVRAALLCECAGHRTGGSLCYLLLVPAGDLCLGFGNSRSRHFSRNLALSFLMFFIFNTLTKRLILACCWQYL